MANIFVAHMERDFTEWTSETDTDGHLNWGAGLAGTMGGAVGTIADTTVGYLVKTGLASVTNVFGARLYFKPSGSTFVATTTGLMSVRSSAANTIASIGVNLQGGIIYARASLIIDTGSAVNIEAAITDAPHYIEFHAYRATTNISADGYLNWWIDGVAQTAITGRDNYDYWGTLDEIRFGMGPYWGVPASVSGTIYLDEFIANDDGGAIGGRASTVDLGALAYGYQFPTMGETGVSWATWDDGAAGAVTVTGDADWGKLNLAVGQEGRSAVYDIGDASPRLYTLTSNRYGTGQGSATLQYRGDTSSFLQDNNVIGWTTYTVPFTQSWRYIQVRETE